MNFIYKIPGYVLIVTGAFFLSWGGLLVREFDSADIWQILFWRAFFFTITLIIFIYSTYKNEYFSVIKKSGLPGILGGFAMSLGFIAYIVSMTQTTVANVLFIISTQTIWLAIFSYLFLKEQISLKTLFSIIVAMIGVAVMIGFCMSKTIIISPHDLLISFILGTFQHACGFICVVIGTRSTPAVTVGLLMLSETLLGPFWVWLFLNEIPPISVFTGGSIILVAVIFKTLEQKRSVAS